MISLVERSMYLTLTWIDVPLVSEEVIPFDREACFQSIKSWFLNTLLFHSRKLKSDSWGSRTTLDAINHLGSPSHEVDSL